MTITRKSLADTYSEQDAIIDGAQTAKREATMAYRAQLDALGMDRDNIKAEIEGFKLAYRRKVAIEKKGEEVIEHRDAIADEIFEEITAPRAPRATRVENIEQFGVDQYAENGEEINLKPSVSGAFSRSTTSEEIIPEHDTDTGEIIEHRNPPVGLTTGDNHHGGDHETHGVANDPISSVAATAAVIDSDDMAAGAGSSAGGGSDVSASDVEPVAPIPEPATIPTAALPAEVAVAAGRNSAKLPAAVPAGDRTKPNPWCADPDDCGVEASWNHMCGQCMRRRDAQRHSAEAVN